MVSTSPWSLAAAVVLLVAIAVGVAWVGRLGSARDMAWASGRAVVQLAVVSSVLAFVLASGWWTAGFVLLMLAVAGFTAAGRIGGDGPRAWWAVLPIACGVAPVLGVVALTGAVPWHPAAVLPVSGIVIGGAMTGTSQLGRLAVATLVDRRGEHEAALSIGLPARDAALMLTRPLASQALLPGIDQTRTVGLVTLPGAFVGVLLGGGSPVQAGAAQIVVLVGILAAQAVAMVLTLEVLARRTV
ncbi:ABC transporter permease [Solicola sp. PLA-1-18]|uniref:ABC transporter permease n=1 Tax=Solicola sp. PLA-1-18 TaxID=3380532 RepID=UPI003B7F97B4